MEVDRRGDLLLAADHPGADEVGDHLGLLGGLRRAAPVGLAGGGTGGAAAAAPLVVPVAVEVGADVAAAGVRLPVLAPTAVAAGGDVVLAAVRVEVRDHPDLPVVDDIGDPAVGGVLVAEFVQQVERHLDGEVLAGVLVGGEEHLGFVLVGTDVVADLDGDDRPALVGGADDPLAHDVGVRGHDGVDVGGGLRVVVVAGVGGREVVQRGAGLGLPGGPVAVPGARQRDGGPAERPQPGGLGGCGRDRHRVGHDGVDRGSGGGDGSAFGDGAGAVEAVLPGGVGVAGRGGGGDGVRLDGGGRGDGLDAERGGEGERQQDGGGRGGLPSAGQSHDCPPVGGP